MNLGIKSTSSTENIQNITKNFNKKKPCTDLSGAETLIK